MSCGVVTITAPVSGTRCDERELDVAGAGRHVDDQVVEVAPVGLAQQLLERLRDHRPAPDHRLVGLDQEADRHHLHAVAIIGSIVLPSLRLGPAGDAHHRRLARAVDVGVEQADRRRLRRRARARG